MLLQDSLPPRRAEVPVELGGTTDDFDIAIYEPDVVLVSSAEETAKDVYAELVRADHLRSTTRLPRHELMTTGDAAPFRALAERFWDHDLDQLDAIRVPTGDIA